MLIRRFGASEKHRGKRVWEGGSIEKTFSIPPPITELNSPLPFPRHIQKASSNTRLQAFSGGVVQKSMVRACCFRPIKGVLSQLTSWQLSERPSQMREEGEGGRRCENLLGVSRRNAAKPLFHVRSLFFWSLSFACYHLPQAGRVLSLSLASATHGICLLGRRRVPCLVTTTWLKRT